jgi:hypothetical protein
MSMPNIAQRGEERRGIVVVVCGEEASALGCLV